jgi:hypothetical protein
MWLLIPVIPATLEAEIGVSLSKVRSREKQDILSEK